VTYELRVKPSGTKLGAQVLLQDIKGTSSREPIFSRDHIVDLEAASNGQLKHPDVRSFLSSSSNFTTTRNLIEQASAAHRIPLDEVRLRAPILQPEKIICVGLNYKDHAKESNLPLPTEPVLFSKYATCIVGPDDAIIKPNVTNEFDYEVELVIVVGKEGKNISRENAISHVAGYTVGHDVSARDWQLKKPGGQWMAGKTFDTFAPIGPCVLICDSDSTFNPHKLKIRCILNGQVVQESNTDQLIFGVEDVVSYISQIVTLRPGDLIFTGTPSGVGFARKPPLFMKPGDEVICEIEHIGRLRNHIVAEK